MIPSVAWCRCPASSATPWAQSRAINAARLALRGTGEHKVSLDKVIRTMWETGNDMKTSTRRPHEAALPSTSPSVKPL